MTGCTHEPLPCPTYCLPDDEREPADPFSQPPPEVGYDDSMPKLDPIWKGWQLFRGETWMEDDGGPIMFKWTAKGLTLICLGDTFGEDDLIMVPPGQLCSCWRSRTCKAHREPSALEAGKVHE